MRRGQQSTTNKSSQPLTLSNKQVVCSATNRQKKVFNFEDDTKKAHLGEQREQNKMYIMQQLLMNQS